MENIPHHQLLGVTEEQIEVVRKYYEMGDESNIQENLKLIEEWCSKQDHLQEAIRCLSSAMLERMYIMAKGSIEATKIKIDKFCTMRGMMPELCLNKTYEEFERLLDIIIYVPMPKINPSDHSRVIITQFKHGKLDELSLLAYFRYGFLIGEYRMNYDYCLSDRYVIDLKHANATLLTKLNPVLLKKAEVLCTEGFGSRIAGIHILNAPSFVDKLVFIIKQGLKEKVANRLHVHSSYEDLHKEVSKDILPKEYGGQEVSCTTLSERWQDVLKTEKVRKLIGTYDNLISDESKRSTIKFNEEYLGMPGSFRKLAVD